MELAFHRAAVHNFNDGASSSQVYEVVTLFVNVRNMVTSELPQVNVAHLHSSPVPENISSVQSSFLLNNFNLQNLGVFGND